MYKKNDEPNTFVGPRTTRDVYTKKSQKKNEPCCTRYVTCTEKCWEYNWSTIGLGPTVQKKLFLGTVGHVTVGVLPNCVVMCVSKMTHSRMVQERKV